MYRPPPTATPDRMVVLLGGAFELVAGLTGGMITFYFFKRLLAWLRTKITIQTIPK